MKKIIVIKNFRTSRCIGNRFKKMRRKNYYGTGGYSQSWNERVLKYVRKRHKVIGIVQKSATEYDVTLARHGKMPIVVTHREPEPFFPPNFAVGDHVWLRYVYTAWVYPKKGFDEGKARQNATPELYTHLIKDTSSTSQQQP